MPPRERRGKSTDKSTFSARDTVSESENDQWDHSPLTQRAWLLKLVKQLKTNAKHTSFAFGNYCTARGKTAVYSAEHAAAIADGTIKTGAHSMEKPMPIGTFKPTATDLEDTLASRFIIAPETLDDEKEEFLSDILAGMSDDGSAEEYRDLCSGDPTKLIGLLHDECDKISAPISEEAERKLERLISGGLTSSDVGTFNHLKTTAITLNKTISAAERYSDSVLAGKLVKAVNKLGREVRRELKAEMRHLSAEGNMNLTSKAIRTVLGDEEAIEEGDEKLGAALAAREPRGNRAPGADARKLPASSGGGKSEKESRPKGMTHPNRSWVAADGNCRHCREPGHWNDDCTKKPAPSAKAAAGTGAAIGQGRVGASVPTDSPSSAAKSTIASMETVIANMFNEAATNGSATVSLGEPCEDEDMPALQANSSDEESASESDDEDDEESDSSASADDEEPPPLASRAHVAKSSAPAPATPPPPPPPPPPATPDNMSYEEVRAAVAALTPKMRLRDEIAPLLKRAKLPVSPQSGGITGRTKVMIVDEARAAVGLSPLSPPMGLPVTSPPPPQQ